MVCFQTKSPNSGKFWSVLQWKILAYVMAIWSILGPSGIFYGFLLYFKVIWNIIPILVSCSKKNLATLPNITIWSIFWRGLAMENGGKFWGHLLYFFPLGLEPAWGPLVRLVELNWAYITELLAAEPCAVELRTYLVSSFVHIVELRTYCRASYILSSFKLSN
jgi:hypothetical protein